MKKKILSVFIAIAFLCISISLSSCDIFETGDSVVTETVPSTSNETIKVPQKASYYKGKDYIEVEADFEELGFTNIQIIRCGNLITGWVSKENTVKEISINGNDSFKSNYYSIDSEIIIYVHSYDYQCPSGHELVLKNKKDGTCISAGLAMDTYYCSTCDEYYSDSKGNGLLNKNDIILLGNHSLVHVEKVDSSCTLEGTSEHYECSICHKWFDDESASHEIVKADCVIDKKQHELVKVEKVDSSCSSFGVEEHYECEKCHALFSDASGTNSITESELKIAKKAHNEVSDPAVDPTYNATGLTAGSHCSTCGEVIVKQKEVERLYPKMGTFTDIKNEASKLGLSYHWSEDFDEDVIHYVMQSSNGGISLDIYYKANTNYVLCTELYCLNAYYTVATEKSIIETLAPYLCPSVDKTDLTSWVHDNLENGAKVKIGKYTYQIEVRNTTNGYTNYCFFAGSEEFEKWLVKKLDF